MPAAWETFADGIEAADALLLRCGYVHAEKAASILTRGGYEAALRTLLRGIFAIARQPDQRAIRAAAERLDVDWPELSAAQRDHIIADAKSSILKVPEIIVPKLRPLIAKQAGAAIEQTKVAAARTHRLRIGGDMNAADARIADYAARSQSAYVTDAYGERADVFGLRVRAIVTNGLERGHGRDEIGKALSQAADGMLGRTDAYWNMVAAVQTTRARSWGLVSSFRDAGIERYTWESVLDEVTSEVCRFMQGKTFEVGAAAQRYEKVEQSPPGAVEHIQPWVRMGKTSDGQQFLYTEAHGQRHHLADVEKPAFGQKDEVGTYSRGARADKLQSLGIDTPPVHGNCRSTLVPE